jgi:hypothetical protein
MEGNCCTAVRPGKATVTASAKAPVANAPADPSCSQPAKSYLSVVKAPERAGYNVTNACGRNVLYIVEVHDIPDAIEQHATSAPGHGQTLEISYFGHKPIIKFACIQGTAGCTEAALQNRIH